MSKNKFVQRRSKFKRLKEEPKIPWRRVDPYNNPEDHECFIQAMLGRSNKCIYGKTGLSNGRISYRLKHWGVKRMEYRDGTSSLAQQVDKVARIIADRALISHLREHARGEQ